MSVRRGLNFLALVGVLVAGCSSPIGGPAPEPLAIAITPPAQWTVPVGQTMLLHAASSGSGPVTWHIAEEDREKSAIQAPDGRGVGSIVTLRAMQPGGVRVLAEVDGKAAEALVGHLDPATSSTPMPTPSGYPTQASSLPTGARLVTDIAAWDAVMAEVRSARPDLSGSLAPPVDLANQSLVVVIADSIVGSPVVTHIERATVHLVHTRSQGYNTVQSQGYSPGIISMLPIPKVPSDASVTTRLLPFTRH